jgi:hypothetical protein
LQTLDIGRVDDEDDGRRVCVVAPPVGADARLTTKILYRHMVSKKEKKENPAEWTMEALEAVQVCAHDIPRR